MHAVSTCLYDPYAPDFCYSPFEFPKSQMHFVVLIVYVYLLVIILCSLWNGQRVIGHGLLLDGESSGFHLSLLFR